MKLLKDIKDQESRVKFLKEEYMSNRSMLEVSGISYENIGAAIASHPTDKMAECIAAVIDYENELKEEEAKLIAMRLTATAMMSKLPNEHEREVLRRWYLLHQKESQIEDEMRCSKSTIYALRQRGLVHLEKIGKNWKNLERKRLDMEDPT